MTRRNWLILWLHAAGKSNYVGVTLEGLTASWNAGMNSINPRTLPYER